MPVFSAPELAQRVERLRRAMANHHLDAVIATSYPGFYYLSGVPVHWFGRPLACVIPLAGEAAIVQSIIEVGHTQANTWIEDIRTYYDYNIQPIYDDPHSPLESMVMLTRDVLHERGLSAARIGYEGDWLPADHLEALRAALPAAEWISAARMLAELRLVLSAEELALVQAADRIADVGQQALLEGIRVGRTAYEVEAEARARMIEAAIHHHPDKPFHLHTISGLGDAHKSAGHSEWITWNNTHTFQPGQILETVVDAWLWGYWGSVERAVSVGEPTPEARRAFAIMIEANEAAIAAVRPGVPLAHVDRAAKQVLSAHGFGTRTGTGCGRGIVSWEGNARELAMDVRLYADVLLEPGMAFSIEPDLQVPGLGTFRHCNTIIVTEDGCQVDSTLLRGVCWV